MFHGQGARAMAAALQSYPGQGLQMAVPQYFPTMIPGRGSDSPATPPPSWLVINCSKQLLG